MKNLTTKSLPKADARAFITSIKRGVLSLRSMLISLHDGRGWEALGYDSWDALVKAEFKGFWSKSYTNRQLAAGRIEQKLLPAPPGGSTVPIGLLPTDVKPIPESLLRPLVGLPEDQQVAAYEAAQKSADKAGKILTAKDVKAQADTYRPAQPDDTAAESAAEPTPCPVCGGEDFHVDGTCASCVQDADPGEDVDPPPERDAEEVSEAEQDAWFADTLQPLVIKRVVDYGHGGYVAGLLEQLAAKVKGM